MMKRVLCWMLILAALTGLMGPLPVRAASVAVTVNGMAVPYSNETGYPYTTDSGAVMIPLAQTMKYYGVILTQDSGSTDVILGLGAKELRIFPGEAKIIVNGNPVVTEAAAVYSGGILYAPAKELVTGLGGYYSVEGGAFAITTQTMDSQVFLLETRAPLSERDLWNTYNAANGQYTAGAYSEAIPAFEQCISFFLTYPDNYNGISLCYKKLATCYARVGDYGKAAAAYNRASYYWSLYGDLQTSLIDHESDKAIREEVSLYLKTSDMTRSLAATHNESYEPASGVVLGYYNEYGDGFQDYSAKEPGIRLKYYPYDADPAVELGGFLSKYEEDFVILLGVEPNGGLSSVNDATTMRLAQYLHGCGKKVMVRFANEMNEASCPWYSENPQEYIDAFIRFAKVFRQYAPEVPLVWAPNFFPENNADDYYPGDEYVDYVGISSYWFSKGYNDAEKAAGYDVLQTGTKTQRWSHQIDFLYYRYGHKKPLMITEGAAAFVDAKTGEQIVDYAAASIYDMYTYLPIRYPNLKFAIYFDTSKGKETYQLNSNQKVLAAYNAAVTGDGFLSSYRDTAEECYVPFDSFPEHAKLPQNDQLCAYVKYGDGSRVAAVRYLVNGTVIGTSNQIPYTVDYDLRSLAGQRVGIRVEVLDAAGSVLTAKQFFATVDTRVSNPAEGLGFWDVPAGAYYENGVRWAVAGGITNGMGEGMFAPDQSCTRAQAVTFLWRAAGSPAPGSSNVPFVDVAADAYYRDAVLWAVEKGITKGTSDTTFSPDATCTRGQIVTFLWRTQNAPEAGSANPFIDVTVSDYYYNAVLWAVAGGITNGMTATTFAPDANCTRAQIVTFLYRAMA